MVNYCCCYCLLSLPSVVAVPSLLLFFCRYCCWYCHFCCHLFVNIILSLLVWLLLLLKLLVFLCSSRCCCLLCRNCCRFIVAIKIRFYVNRQFLTYHQSIDKNTFKDNYLSPLVVEHAFKKPLCRLNKRQERIYPIYFAQSPPSFSRNTVVVHEDKFNLA